MNDDNYLIIFLEYYISDLLYLSTGNNKAKGHVYK